MLTIAQLLLTLTLVPLLGGIVLLFMGTRVSVKTGLIVAIVATVLMTAAAIAVVFTVIPEGPQLATLVQFGADGLEHRVDGFSALLALGLAGWVTPVLVWMTTPRGAIEEDQRPSLVPQGLALIAVSMALGAVLNDNALLIALCWGGAGFVAWLMARPTPLQRPTTEECFDLVFIALGPLFFVLAMLPAIVKAHSASLWEMPGHNLFGAGDGFLVLLALAFASGIYPFTLWVRRVNQGIMTDAIGVLLLTVLPIPAILVCRLAAVITVNGDWPMVRLGPASFTLNLIFMLLGIITVLVSGIVLLFEVDLPVITSLLATLTLGWIFTAVGTGDAHALQGAVFLFVAYGLGIGTLMAAWATLEWNERELAVTALNGLVHDMPMLTLAIALAGLSLVGIPLFVGFAGMAPIDQSMLTLGGATILGGAIIWIGNVFALFGFVRALSRSLNQIPAAETMPRVPEAMGFVVPVILLLVLGIAPELLLIGKTPGLAQLAAGALLPTGTSIPDLATTALGFTIDGTQWLPGLFWALAVVGAAAAVLSTALIGSSPVASPVFAGGEPLESTDSIDTWDDLASLARSALTLPGPATWRSDIGNLEDWNDADNETLIVETEAVVMTESEFGADEPDDESDLEDDETDATMQAAEDERDDQQQKRGAP